MKWIFFGDLFDANSLINNFSETTRYQYKTLIINQVIK